MRKFLVWEHGKPDEAVVVQSYSPAKAAEEWANEMDAPNDNFILAAGDAGVKVCVSNPGGPAVILGIFTVRAEATVVYDARPL